MVADLTTIDFKDAFDLIICVDVLEHIKDDYSIVKNFYRALKPGGFIIIHVPKFPRDFTHLVKEYHQDDHVRDGYTEEQLLTLLEDNGFKIIKIRKTFNYFGSLAWDIGHILYNKNKIIFLLVFPVLLLLSKLDALTFKNRGNGILILAQKPNNGDE